MLNAYISKEEILKLLESSECINGMINKREFQQAILNIKEHKKPKKEKKIRVNNAEYIIDNIKKYQKSITENKKISYLYLLKKNRFWQENDIDQINIFSCTDNRLLLKENRCVGTLESLLNILQITKPTLKRWLQLKIITQKEEYIEFESSVDNHIYGYTVIEFYDLEEIKTILKRYIPAY